METPNTHAPGMKQNVRCLRSALWKQLWGTLDGWLEAEATRVVAPGALGTPCIPCQAAVRQDDHKKGGRGIAWGYGEAVV